MVRSDEDDVSFFVPFNPSFLCNVQCSNEIVEYVVVNCSELIEGLCLLILFCSAQN